jgi:hypothetical protein
LKEKIQKNNNKGGKVEEFKKSETKIIMKKIDEGRKEE